MAIQTNKALFKVVGNTTSPSTARGYNAVAGEVLSFQLEDSTGVLNALWETYDPASSSSPLSTLNAPTFPFTGSGSPAFTSSAPPFSGAATVPTPSGGQPLSNSYFVRCTVATATGSQSFTRSINCTGGLGRKPVPGEVTENSLRGWADDWAALVDNTTPILMVFANAAARRAQALTVADLGRRGLQLDTAKIWDVVPSLVSPGTYTWGDNAGPETAVDFSSFFTAGTVLQSVQSDRGITTGATFTWADQSGNGKHYTQSTAGKQPTLTTGLNGNPGVRLSAGSHQLLLSSLNLPAPGTTPTWIGIVWRIVTATAVGRVFCDTSGLTHTAYMATSDSHLTQYNGSGGNVDGGFTINAWECDEYYFSNSASDYIKRGSVAPVTGTGSGNSASTGRTLGGSDVANVYADAEVLHVIYVNSKQVTAIANWRAAVAATYGGTVSV